MSYEEHDQHDLEGLRDALVGRSVVAVRRSDENEERTVGSKYGPKLEGQVYLDDGTVLKLAGNEGGCACSAGDYALTSLAEHRINGITNVEVSCEPTQSDERWDKDAKTYRIFVLAFDGRHELASFEGDDGNGYYGTGFWFEVVKPGEGE